MSTTILFRVHIFLYNLANYFFSYFLPKTWTFYGAPPSSRDQQQIQQQTTEEEESNVSLANAYELKRVFQMFDHDQDGMITKHELVTSLKKIGITIPNEEVGRMMEKVDVNGDGCIDVYEFQLLYRSIMENDGGSMDAVIKEAFDVFDRNGDGFISADELRSVLACLGIGDGRETSEDCERMIRRVDEDGDGRVNFAEFKRMLTTFVH